MGQLHTHDSAEKPSPSILLKTSAQQSARPRTLPNPGEFHVFSKGGTAAPPSTLVFSAESTLDTGDGTGLRGVLWRCDGWLAFAHFYRSERSMCREDQT